jgi:uncharacterized DUF497 family protein
LHRRTLGLLGGLGEGGNVARGRASERRQVTVGLAGRTRIITGTEVAVAFAVRAEKSSGRASTCNSKNQVSHSEHFFIRGPPPPTAFSRGYKKSMLNATCCLADPCRSLPILADPREKLASRLCDYFLLPSLTSPADKSSFNTNEAGTNLKKHSLAFHLYLFINCAMYLWNT